MQRDELSVLSASPDYRDAWRDAADRVAAGGNSVQIGACAEVGVAKSFLDLWFRRSVPGTTGAPGEAALDDYPSVNDQPDVAATGLDRSMSLGKICCYPMDFHLPDKVRMVHTRSDPPCGLNQLLANLAVTGRIHGRAEFSRLFRPLAGLPGKSSSLGRPTPSIWPIMGVCASSLRDGTKSVSRRFSASPGRFALRFTSSILRMTCARRGRAAPETNCS